MRTRGQIYSKKIYTHVIQAAERDKQVAGYGKKYGTMAHRLPILVRTAGLVQAVAFVEAKRNSNEAWGDYLDNLAQTLGKTDGPAFLQSCQEVPITQYIHLTNQANEAMVWFKRFAEAILKVEPGDELEAEPVSEEGETT